MAPRDLIRLASRVLSTCAGLKIGLSLGFYLWRAFG
jgi:hypothetical protein